jgi:hypothetical protein
MFTKLERHPRLAALEQAIKLQILERTGGRIRSLEVKVADNRVAVHGCVVCYYLKQLALQGVHDVLGSRAAMGIDLNLVEVMGGSPITT